ncbi:MAG: VOC family protein [bacterium]|nr:VOC family protein [bacterium]
MIMPILTVKDVARSITFYEKIGFREQMALDDAQGVKNFAIVERGSLNIALGVDETHEFDRYAPGVQFMIYLDPADQSIDDHHAQTVNNGIAIATELGTAYWGDRTYSITDPDGYFLTIAQEHHAVDMEYVAKVHRGEAAPDKTE